MSINNFDDSYKMKIEIYERAKSRIEEDLSYLIEDLRKSGSGLFRAKVVGSRVKDIASVKRKAIKNYIPPHEIFNRMKDIIGIRIVTNNINDIDNLIDKVKYHPHFRIMQDDNKIFTPESSGYRARHVIIEYSVVFETTTVKVLCELQIRTLLQDAWANIVHEDIYKHSKEIPPLINFISKNMADLLYVIDNLGDKIIEEAKKEVKSVEIAGTEVNKTNLAFIYYSKFGSYPQEFALQEWIKYLREAEIDSVAKVIEYFPNEHIKMALNGIYVNYFPELEEISNDDFIIFGTKAMVNKRKAFREFESIIRKRRETSHESISDLSDLPDTIEIFINRFINTDDIFYERFIDFMINKMPVNKTCQCGYDFLDTNKCVEIILNYYGEKEDKWGLLSTINKLTAFDPDGQWCNICYARMTRDD